MRAEGVEPSGHAVIKARANGNDQVGPVHRHVGFIGAVHAQHAEPVGMTRRKSAQAHQGRGDRGARQFLQLAQQFRCARTRIDHAAAGVEDRRLGIGDQLDCLGNVAFAALVGRVVADRTLRRAFAPRCRGDLHVLGNVDHDRARAAGRGDLERLVHDGGQFRRVLHQIVVLGAVAGDADGIGFLERVRADQAGRDLAGDDDQRDRIHEGIGNAGDRIRRARAGRDQDHAGLAGRTGIAFCRVGRACFVPDQDVPDAGIAKQGVVNRQHGSTRIAEHEFDSLTNQAFNQNAGAAALLAHLRLPFNFCAFASPCLLKDRPGTGGCTGSPLQLGANAQAHILQHALGDRK